MTPKVFALVAALASAGCARSHYRPVDSPRLSRVWLGGATYRKDGKRYDDLREAVRDNPRALAEAEKAHSLEVWGTALALGGIGTEVAGFTMIGAGQTDEVKAAGVVTVLVALGAEIAFFVVAAHSVPRTEDAMNIYNDGVLRGAAGSPTVAPAGSTSLPTQR